MEKFFNIKELSAEGLVEVARGFSCRYHLKKTFPGVYKKILRLGIQKLAFSHMPIKNKKLSNEELRLLALNFVSRIDFKNKHPGPYQAAYKRGILNEICKHMPYICYPCYTMEQFISEALKYDNFKSFKHGSPKIYDAAYKRKIIDEICGHFTRKRKKISEKEILEAVGKCVEIKDFYSNFKEEYQAARGRGILKEIKKRLKQRKRDKFKNEELGGLAQKYPTRHDFEKGDRSAYFTCAARGILDQVCSHMGHPADSSDLETDLFNLIKEKYPNSRKLKKRRIKISDKPHVHGFDIDIFIPELNKGIEFDGLYWHSVEGLKRSRKKWPEEDLINYHKIKDDYFLSIGIEILHIKESDWDADKNNCIQKCLEFLKKENKNE